MREGWSAGSFEQKGCLSCAKREACIRRLCSTVVYDYLLTAVFLVSPPFVSRISDRRVSTYGDLGCSLSGLLGCLRNYPARTPRSSASVASRNGKGAYLRRCAHITPTDKLASLSSCLCLFFSSSSLSDFPRSYSSLLFLQSR